MYLDSCGGHFEVGLIVTRLRRLSIAIDPIANTAHAIGPCVLLQRYCTMVLAVAPSTVRERGETHTIVQ
jgi:hypothetical protein